MDTNGNTKELIKDLCSRLPYGVKLECKWKTPAPNGTYGMITTMDSFVLDQVCNIEDTDVPFDEFKPYLFPLSSMTKEQKKELCDTLVNLSLKVLSDEINSEVIATYEVDFYNKHHFDYHGLIPKGLAKDATGLNIY